MRPFESVTRDGASGTLFIKLVNATTGPEAVTVHLTGGGRLGASGHVHLLSAPSTESTNSITDPVRIVPAEHDLPVRSGGLQMTLAPLSIDVLEAPTRR